MACAAVCLALAWASACSDGESSRPDASTDVDAVHDGDASDGGPDTACDAGGCAEPEPGCDGGAEVRTRYRSASVAYGEDCDSQVQTRACEGEGAWSGSFEHEACTVEPAAGCGDVAHGASETRVRYQAVTVAYGQVCVSEEQRRACDNGGFGDWSGSYGAETCTVEPPADCGAVAHGGSETRVRFAAASVPYGQSCVSEQQARVCENGSFGAWDGTLTEPTCLVAPPADCGGTEHGQSVVRVRFETADVPYGHTCNQEMQVGQCDNGTLVGWTGTFTFEACSVLPPEDCGGTPHGESESRVRYDSDGVPLGQVCDDPSNMETQTRTCDNGVFGSWSGTFDKEQCFDNCGGLRHGQYNSRNQAPVANVEAWRGGCPLQRQEQYCIDGELMAWMVPLPISSPGELPEPNLSVDLYTYAYRDCRAVDETGCDATPDGEVEERVMYESASVSGPDSCVSEPQIRTCVAGAFGDWTGTFTQPTCQVQSGFAGSCLAAGASRCSDFDGTAHGAASVEADCEATGGSYSSMACDASAAVGHCAIGDASSLVTVHDLAPTTALASQDACMQLHALWTP